MSERPQTSGGKDSGGPTTCGHPRIIVCPKCQGKYIYRGGIEMDTLRDKMFIQEKWVCESCGPFIATFWFQDKIKEHP